MDRLTEKTIGCFEYDLKNHKHVVGEFSSYNAFYSYSMAVKRLGQYEDTGFTPEEITALQEAVGGKEDADWAVEAVECRRETAGANMERIRLDKENKALRAQLADTQAQLAEAVGALEYIEKQILGDYHESELSPLHEAIVATARDFLATPAAKAGERVRAMERVVAAADELNEVANLRGDNELPASTDDPKLWMARMQDAWNELGAALQALEVAGDG